ncbi:hypothetical protein MGSAQ_000727 [marine sediment metagenome]|uniref:Uncharacterized protein n=1 Tax=marine sediment metagenome TaxID=412755 RepID=A0A1B6NYC3_9ZZZZ
MVVLSSIKKMPPIQMKIMPAQRSIAFLILLIMQQNY